MPVEIRCPVRGHWMSTRAIPPSCDAPSPYLSTVPAAAPVNRIAPPIYGEPRLQAPDRLSALAPPQCPATARSSSATLIGTLLKPRSRAESQGRADEPQAPQLRSRAQAEIS